MLRLTLPHAIRADAARLPADVDIRWYIDGGDCPDATVDSEVLWLTMWRTSEIERTLHASDSLRWVFTSDAGMDSAPLALFRERGVTLTNGRGLHATPVAEYVVMAMLAAAKGFPALIRAQDQALWLSGPPAFGELYGTNALIVGYGEIGHAIAQRLRPFGVVVTAVRGRPSSEDDDVIGPEAWRARLGEFDWVILSTALTNETRRLISCRELSTMKATAWLLNVSRGQVVDQPALELALRGGTIGGAYLDLTDPEPLPEDSELWHMPNVIVTPHTSQASRRTGERAMELFLDNLGRYRTGQPLRNVVDLERGY